MGKYSSIWEQLKKEKRIVLAVPTRLQKRVIKGVIHTKSYDAMFAYECASKGFREKIVYVQEAARVTIVLKREISLVTLMKAIDTSAPVKPETNTATETEGG